MARIRLKPGSAATLALGAALAAWIAYEGTGPTEVQPDGVEVLKPYVPVQGDVPTIGHGATYYEDGRRVTLADPPITRQRARELATWHLSSVYMRCVVESLGETPVHPEELQLAVDHAGQYGCGGWRSSPMARAYAKGDHAAACAGYLSYRYMTSDRRLGAGWQPYTAAGGRTRYRFDCSTPGNKTCRGVWTRSVGRYDACTAQL